jgi:acetyl-CoA carboxylase carboxyltransferase component
VSWKREVDQIEERRRLATQLGGEEAVARQHERGRLTIRERIGRLADAGSFCEQGPLAGFSERDEKGELTSFAPANYVLGLTKIDGRPCVVGGEDFTQRGGSPSPAGLRKSVYAEDLACHYRLPLVRFLEGGGGSVTGSAGKGKAGGGRPRAGGDPVYAPPRFASIARILETAPVVSAAVGAVAGFPAARLVASHLSIMTRETSQVMVGGPALVERALGEKKTKEELGGHQVHLRSGVVDNLAEDEDDAVRLIRRFLSYLPTNVSELPPRRWGPDEPTDPPERCDEALLGIIPRDRRKVYKMRRVIEGVVDRDSFFETTPRYGRTQITGLARLHGYPIGVFANDPFFYLLRRRHGSRGSTEGAPLHPPVRHLPPSDRELRGRAGLHDRPGCGVCGHDPLRAGGHRGGGAIPGAMGLGDRAQGLRRGRRRALRSPRQGSDLALDRDRGAAHRRRSGRGLPP